MVLPTIRDKPTYFKTHTSEKLPGCRPCARVRVGKNAMENPLATTYRNDRKRQTAPMSMVTQCILIVPRKVPSSRETASGRVSDEFLRSLDFSMSTKGLSPCLTWKPALLPWLASALLYLAWSAGRVWARHCPPLPENRLRLSNDGSRECACRSDDLLLFHRKVVAPMSLCSVSAVPDAWCRRLLEGLLVQPRGYVRLLQWGAASGEPGIGPTSTKQKSCRSGLDCTMERKANPQWVYLRRAMPQG